MIDLPDEIQLIGDDFDLRICKISGIISEYNYKGHAH